MRPSNDQKQGLIYYRKRIVVDCFFLVGALAPPCIAFYLDFISVTENVFVRSGAITTLFAVFLEFRTHEVHERESLIVIWRNIGAIVEELSRVETELKTALMKAIIKNRSRVKEPLPSKDGYDPSELEVRKSLKNLPVTTERLKPVQKLPPIEDFFLQYNHVLSKISKLLVLIGTLVWAFGDVLVLWIQS